MKKLFLIVVALALVAIPAVVFADAVIKGKAHAKPPTQVKAKFKFVEHGGVLTITGKGKGFEPGESYVSLIYGIGSLVKGPGACEPSGTALTDPIDLMFVGFWDVSANGKGTLIQAGPASGASLTDIATISVRREVFIPPSGPTNPLIVEACGWVK